MKIKWEWGGERVKLIDIDDWIFYGIISDITGKADNEDTGRDSLTLYDGKNYIAFSDNEIKSIEILDQIQSRNLQENVTLKRGSVLECNGYKKVIGGQMLNLKNVRKEGNYIIADYYPEDWGGLAQYLLIVTTQMIMK